MSGSILLLGESDVGKTHFGGQLLGRLNLETGVLRMAGTPVSIEPFEAVLAALNSGRSAPHTSRDVYVESRWPVCDATGRTSELIWPDYGGEQVRLIRSERRMPPAWRTRVEQASAWIMMVRIAHTQVSDDIFSRPLSSLAERPEPPASYKISAQADILDFLQWLMFVRETGMLKPVSSPPLTLLLSCWDELPDAELGQPPLEVLRHRMPMVCAFIEANWMPSARRVLGLSALSHALDEKRIDEDYVDNGPEAFGYVVLEDGSKHADLTLAIHPVA